MVEDLVKKSDALLELLSDHRCHLQRDDKKMSDFIKKEFDSYIADLKAACKYEKNPLVGKETCDLIADKVYEIENITEDLVKVLTIHERGNIVEASKLAFSIFDKMKPYLLRRLSGEWKKDIYYRIRPKDDFDLKREELFHVPLTKRHLVKTERYSMPGHPCLYLSSQAVLCWYECGCPDIFAIAKYDIPQDASDHMTLIDFNENLLLLKHSFISWFHKEKDKDLVRNYLLKYLYTIPLRAICSVEVRYSDASFKEEYIVSQLLMQWIVNSNEFDGVIYESCKAADEVRKCCGHNIVLVTKSFDEDGYDTELRRRLKIGNPSRFDINKIIPEEHIVDLLNGASIKENPWYWNMDSISSEYKTI